MDENDDDDFCFVDFLLNNIYQLNGEGDEQEPVLTEEEKQEKRLAEGIGLPHIIVNCDLNEKTPLTKVLDAGKLPPAEEVSKNIMNK